MLSSREVFIRSFIQHIFPEFSAAELQPRLDLVSDLWTRVALGENLVCRSWMETREGFLGEVSSSQGNKLLS